MTIMTIRNACLAALVLTLAGCAAQPSSAPPVPRPANPVALVRETGAVPGGGQVEGSTDGRGSRMATGAFPGGETVTVYTAAGLTASEMTAAYPGLTPDDAHGVIAGPGFLIVVTAVNELTGGQATLTFAVPAATIAQRVHGELLTH